MCFETEKNYGLKKLKNVILKGNFRWGFAHSSRF